MKGTTTGEDIFKELEKSFVELELKWDKLISITTDGCPSLTGQNKGLIAIIKIKIEETNSGQELFPFHCIIHQQVLCKKVLKLKEILKTVTGIINYIRSSGLKHRQFIQL